MKKVKPHAVIRTLWFLISNVFGQIMSYTIHIDTMPNMIIGILNSFQQSEGYDICAIHNNRKDTGMDTDFRFDNLSKKQEPNMNQNIPNIGKYGIVRKLMTNNIPQTVYLPISERK